MVPISHLERMMGGSELCTGAALDFTVKARYLNLVHGKFLKMF